MNPEVRALLATVLLASPVTAGALVLDLGHPTIPPVSDTAIGPGDRNVVFDVTADFSIESAGIVFDPLIGGATTLRVEIHSVLLTGGVGTRGALLGSAQIPIADAGFGFYDVPISFDFAAGERYDIGFRPVEPETWGGDINDMEFYVFDYPAEAYSVAALLTVIDGGRSGFNDGTGGGYGNGIMPHVRLGAAAAVTEPGSLALFGLGLAGLWLRRSGRFSTRPDLPRATGSRYRPR